MQVLPPLGQGHDGVGGELSGPVEGDIPAALHLQHRDPARGQHVLLRVAPSAQSEHRVVLHQQQPVRPARDDLGQDLLLARPAVGVVRPPEVF